MYCYPTHMVLCGEGTSLNGVLLLNSHVTLHVAIFSCLLLLIQDHCTVVSTE